MVYCLEPVSRMEDIEPLHLIPHSDVATLLLDTKSAGAFGVPILMLQLSKTTYSTLEVRNSICGLDRANVAGLALAPSE